MEEQNKVHNTGKMDIKRYSEGERLEINYSGGIQIITTEKWRKTIRQANKAKEYKDELEQVKEQHKNELKQLKEQYEFELARLRNQLTEELNKARKAYENLRQQANRKLSEAEQQVLKAQHFLDNQGKGRPSKLSEQHKAIIQSNMHYLENGETIQGLYRFLVKEAGYTGQYEAVRAYVAELRKRSK